MPGYQAEKNQNAKQLLQSLQTSLRDFASRHRNRILDGEKKAASRLPYLPAYGIALMILWYSVSWPPPQPMVSSPLGVGGGIVSKKFRLDDKD